MSIASSKKPVSFNILDTGKLLFKIFFQMIHPNILHLLIHFLIQQGTFD